MKVIKESINNDALFEASAKASSSIMQHLEDAAAQNTVREKNLVNTLDHIYGVNVDEFDEIAYASEKKGKSFQPVNLLIVGEPGGGKTSIIEQWAEENDVALLTITGSNLTDTIANGLPMKDEYADEKDPDANGNPKKKARQVYLPSTVFDDLDDADGRYSVLFIDEINRAYPEAQAALLTLIQSHKTSNFFYEKGQRKYEQFLFTIAACNPPSTDEGVETLSRALNNRFRFFPWHSDPKETKAFWDEVFDDRLEGMKKAEAAGKGSPRLSKLMQGIEGKKFIIDTLVDSGQFKFEDTNEGEDELGLPTRTLSARSLASCVKESKGIIGDIVETDAHGNNRYTPFSFLDIFQDHCGSGSFKMVEAILLKARKKQKQAEERKARKIAGAQDTLLDLWRDWEEAHPEMRNDIV